MIPNFRSLYISNASSTSWSALKRLHPEMVCHQHPTLGTPPKRSLLSPPPPHVVTPSPLTQQPLFDLLPHPLSLDLPAEPLVRSLRRQAHLQEESALHTIRRGKR